MRRSLSKGSALIEFAIALAVLTPVAIWGVQTMQSLYFLYELEDGVRIGADFASHARREDADNIKKLVVAKCAVPGLRKEQVRVDWEDAKVSVAIDGYVISGPTGRLHLDGRPRATLPWLAR